MGRDNLFQLLAVYGLPIRKKKRKPITTDSSYPFLKYSSLVKGVSLTRFNQLWVSDITYIRIADRFAYLSLVTNAFPRKIIGCCLHHTLGTIGRLYALQIAIKVPYLPMVNT